jgi:sec-independent protein translocase protein TatB
MFDVGFSEMLVIAIVALVVIGPERLPRVARTAGILFGRLQRYVTQVKSDIHREMEAADLGKVKTEFESAARSIKEDIESQAADAERGIREAQADLDRELGSVASAVSAGPPPAESPAASPQLELGIEEPPPPAPSEPTKPA